MPESINLFTFIAVMLVSYFGAFVHWRKMKRGGRSRASFFHHLTSANPSRSGITALAIAGAAWLNITSGIGDNINPELVFNLLTNGELHIPTIAAFLSTFWTGYAADSQLNGDGQ